jgi:molybdenum-dependent DNA-binding transcriptional regulator ModE
MEKDILRAIVEVEREIQELLVAEQRQSDERLAKVRQECAEKIAKEEERLQEELTKAVAVAAGPETQQRAAALVAEASRQAERFDRLDDESLRRWIQRELFLVVPGGKP